MECHLDAEPAGDGTLTGSVLDKRYLVGPMVGRGGMGTVYRGENLRIGRIVALKVLHKELHADSKMRVRLFREVQATSRVQHPNVVEIYDYGEDPVAGAFLVMEYLEGESLGQILRDQGRLALDGVLKIGLQLCSGLAATHGLGLIHRDLKPSNIRLLPCGTAKILDFGLVKAFEREHDDEFLTITTGGVAFGTPWYMSPEQAGFRPLDPRSDLYSFGVVLYELLVGQPPFDAKNAIDLLDAHRHQAPPLPKELVPSLVLPSSMELLLLKLLSKAPCDRHQSVAELMDDLYGIAEEQGIDVSEISAAGGLGKRTSRTYDVPLGERSDNTVAMTAAFWPPDRGIDARTLATAHLDELVESVAEQLQGAIPRYRGERRLVLTRAIRAIVEVAVNCLGGSPIHELPEALRHLADERTDQAFTVTELLAALLLGLSEGRFRLRLADNDLDSYIALQRQIDHHLIPLLLKLVDYYFARYNRRQIRLNEMLGRRNEELQKLRGRLAEQLRDTTNQLADLERLKAKVTDNISSGLVLVEPGSHAIVMFNRAMERLCGISASEVVHRPFEDVMHFVDGLPFDEFLEQLRMRGEVGLRKLRLLFPNGVERTVFVRGQTFFGPDHTPTATLFVVDDVTERDQLVSAFSRYLPKELASHVLRQRSSLSPGSHHLKAVVMAIDLPGFDPETVAGDMSASAELLSAYLSLVVAQVTPRGGSIAAMVGTRLLVYFTGVNAPSCGPPAEAATELCRHGSAESERRVALGKGPLALAIGLDLGELSLVHVSSDDRCAFTPLGRGVGATQALVDAAQPFEILVTAAVRDQLGSAYRLSPLAPTRAPATPPLDAVFALHWAPTDSEERTTTVADPHRDGSPCLLPDS